MISRKYQVAEVSKEKKKDDIYEEKTWYSGKIIVEPHFSDISKNLIGKVNATYDKLYSAFPHKRKKIDISYRTWIETLKEKYPRVHRVEISFFHDDYEPISYPLCSLDGGVKDVRNLDDFLQSNWGDMLQKLETTEKMKEALKISSVYENYFRFYRFPTEEEKDLMSWMRIHSFKKLKEELEKKEEKSPEMDAAKNRFFADVIAEAEEAVWKREEARIHTRELMSEKILPQEFDELKSGYDTYTVLSGDIFFSLLNGEKEVIEIFSKSKNRNLKGIIHQ